MDSLICNFELSYPMPIESALLHSAYLLSDRTIEAGGARQFYLNSKDHDIPLKAKLEVLSDAFKNEPGFDELPQSIKMLMDAKKIKHPSGKIIGTIRMAEKCLMDMFRVYWESVESRFYGWNYIQFEELSPYGFFDWYHLQQENLVEVPGEKQATAKDILQLLPGKNPGRQLSFYLPSLLFDKIPGFQLPTDCTTDLNEVLPGLSFLHPCYTLPDLRTITKAELHSIKMQLQPLTALYHASTNAWIECCKKNTATNSSLSFFSQQVLPAAAGVQQALSQHKLLQSLRHEGNKELEMTVYLGEISPAAVWEVLNANNYFTKVEIWESIAAEKDNPSFNRPLPFMLLQVPQGYLPAKKEQDTLLTLKKSICID